MKSLQFFNGSDQIGSANVFWLDDGTYLANFQIKPEYQRQGIGKRLIEEGHKIARKLGYHYSIVLGSEKYYPKFGYIPASQYGIIAPFEVQNKNFMAIKLNYSNKEISGIVKYAKEFGV